MKTNTLIANLSPCAGLAGPVLLWAVTTQLAQVSPYHECGASVRPSLWVSLAAIALSLVCALISWRAGRDRGPASVYPVSHRFVRALGAGFALLFAYAMALQALSYALLTGCER